MGSGSSTGSLVIEDDGEWGEGVFQETEVKGNSLSLSSVNPSKDWFIVHPDSTKALHYFPSDEDGTFGSPAQFGGSYHGEDDGGVVASQFSGGDNWDLVSFDTTSDKWYLWEDIGSSAPSSPTCTIYSGSYSSKAQGVDAGDLDDDGDMDVVSLEHGIWLENTGDCSWNQHSLGVDGHRDVVLGDFNNDGCDDIVYEDGNNDINYAPGHCDGSFGSSSQVYDTGTWLGRGDFDEDGNLDLIINYNQDGDVHILSGDGDGTFSTSRNFDLSYGHANPSVYDFDRDGYPDIILGEHGDGDVNYWSSGTEDTITRNPNGILASYDGTLGVAAPQEGGVQGLGVETSGTYSSKLWDSGASIPQLIRGVEVDAVLDTDESLEVRAGVDTDDDGSVNKWSHSSGSGLEISDGVNRFENIDFGIDAGYRYKLEFDFDNLDRDSDHYPSIAGVRLSTRDKGLAASSEDSEPSARGSKLEGKLLDKNEQSVEAKFQYRSKGSSNWKNTSAQTLSSTGGFEASISGLSPGESYEWRAWVDNGSHIRTGGPKTFRSWWNGSWDYRKRVNLSSGYSGNVSDRYANIEINTSSLIEEGKMGSKCEDMRWINKKGDRVLNYWIESGCNTTETEIILEISELKKSSEKTFYLYYGNSGASEAEMDPPSEFMIAHGDDRDFKYYRLRDDGSFSSGTRFGDNYAGEDDGGLVVSRFLGNSSRDMVSFDAKRGKWYLWKDIGVNPPEKPYCTVYSGRYSEKAQGVDAGDIDNDGDMDVVSNEHGIWLENTGTCDWKEHSLPNDEYRDIVVADFDNDSCQDIIYDYNQQRADMRSGNCDGTFGASETVYQGENDFWLGAGDLDNDGNEDLIINDQGAKEVYIFSGFGNGSFKMVNNISDETYDHINPSTYDVNDDGRLDWVGAEHRDHEIHYFENLGDFNFSKSTVEPSYNNPLGISIFHRPSRTGYSISVGSEKRPSICDFRREDNSCVINSRKDVNSESITLDSVFEVSKGSIMESLGSTASFELGNASYLAGVWRGSFNISTPEQDPSIITPGAEFRPQGDGIILN